MDLAGPCAPPIVRVIDRRGQHHDLVGWAADMVALILAYHARINGADHGAVTLHFGKGSGVSIGLNEPEMGRSR